MTNRQGFEDVLKRVQRFEQDLKFIGVDVKVDIREIDVDSHQYGSHEARACVLCAAYKRGFADGRYKGASERTARFEGAMNRLLDRD